ncbi:MAG: hypothetical protein ACLFSI_02240 [Halorhodospira sp.]
MVSSTAQRSGVPTWVTILAYISSILLPTLGLLLGMYLGYRRVLLHAFLVVGLSTIAGFFWYPLVLG